VCACVRLIVCVYVCARACVYIRQVAGEQFNKRLIKEMESWNFRRSCKFVWNKSKFPFAVGSSLPRPAKSPIRSSVCSEQASLTKLNCVCACMHACEGSCVCVCVCARACERRDVLQLCMLVGAC